jgi:hypothetical protein
VWRHASVSPEGGRGPNWGFAANRFATMHEGAAATLAVRATMAGRQSILDGHISVEKVNSLTQQAFGTAEL